MILFAFLVCFLIFASVYSPKGGLSIFCSYYRTYLILLTFIFTLTKASAQTEPTDTTQENGRLPSIFSVGLGTQYGFIFAHSQDVQNTQGANPFGTELILSWQRNDPDTWNLCHCFPRNGLLLNYYNFDNAILGKGFSAAYFLEPTYKLTGKAFFSFKGSAGFSYLNNPHNEATNPANQSYSTNLNAYLLLGVGAWFQLGEHWWLNPSVNYQHISNGGLSKPNKGINWPTAGVAISYQPISRTYYTQPRTTEKYWRGTPPRWDLTAFGIARRGYDAEGNRERFPMLGLALQGAKQVGRLSNLTLGAELYYDAELKARLANDSINASPIKAGIMAGHEFILGQFLFSQRLGVYAFDQSPYFDRIYHRWGIHYSLNHNFGFGFNLLAHRQVAEFIDLRVTYSLQRK
ncbi:acyloxyacyl hydrolase [Pontibacter sp. 13R65]|uniref:acyloxyacyl hydrolase n=1 Tax=Pontibacter sp. 13R65 TaxID=3127458 RepID=UPI00301CED69